MNLIPFKILLNFLDNGISLYNSVGILFASEWSILLAGLKVVSSVSTPVMYVEFQ